MERTKIKAAIRAEHGKSAARQFRRQGLVTAVLYGKGQTTFAVTVEETAVQAIIASGVYTTHIYDLQVSGEQAPAKPVPVMIAAVQRHPITRKFWNIDFHAISLKEKIHAQVPIAFQGEPAGLKRGGILERLHLEISVSCLPTDIPDHFEVDISKMEIGDSVHARDLSIPKGVEMLTPGDDMIAQVAHPAKAVEETVAPTAEVEGAEPELVGQKGDKEEEEG
jgi:large subunit ribosomal protein L25